MKHAMMTALAIGAVLALTGAAQAAMVQLDFGGPDATYSGFGFWNGVVDKATDTTLSFSDGSVVSGVSVAAPNNMNTGSGLDVSGWGNAVGTPNDAMNMFFFGGQTTQTMTISGLVPTSVYTVTLIDALPATAADRTTDWTINGSFAPSPLTSPDNGDNWRRVADGWNGKKGIVFAGISPDALGQFVITGVNVDGSNNSSINAAIISNTSGEFSIPEPATMSLLALGGLAGLIRRRR